jgi:hypothetical protein
LYNQNGKEWQRQDISWQPVAGLGLWRRSFLYKAKVEIIAIIQLYTKKTSSLRLPNGNRRGLVL